MRHLLKRVLGVLFLACLSVSIVAGNQEESALTPVGLASASPRLVIFEIFTRGT